MSREGHGCSYKQWASGSILRLLLYPYNTPSIRKTTSKPMKHKALSISLRYQRAYITKNTRHSLNHTIINILTFCSLRTRVYDNADDHQHHQITLPNPLIIITMCEIMTYLYACGCERNSAVFVCCEGATASTCPNGRRKITFVTKYELGGCGNEFCRRMLESNRYRGE